jgi:hypothetical protein
MADEPTLPERLLELALYVPVGLAAVVVEELPSLAEKGREKLGGQVQLARMIGKMAVSEVQRKVGRATSKPNPPAPVVPSRPVATAPPAASSSPPSQPRPPASAPAARPPKAAAQRRPAATKAASSGSVAEAPTAALLPIPGYDTLAASQVVQRLGSLRPEELDAVRRYEVATRGRRTILHRIAQLSSEEGRASA